MTFKKIPRAIKYAAAIITVALFAAVFIYLRNTNNITKAKTVDGQARALYYGTYGTHFNVSGNIKTYNENTELSLTLKSKHTELEYALLCGEDDNSGAVSFTVSDKINGGIYLENLQQGEYDVLLKSVAANENTVYYTISNDTQYGDIDYYTLSKNADGGANRRITIGFKNGTMNLEVKEDQLPEKVYDIIIEVGHGGDDPGAVSTYNGQELFEKDLNRLMAEEIEKKLTKAGYKIRLTHYADVDLPSYGKAGRATLPNEAKAKYCFSVHNNASIGSVYRGVEVYAPYNADYTFAKLLADSIVNGTNAVYSNNTDRVSPEKGVFIRTFDDETMPEMLEQATQYGFEPYDITYETNYYFMIREVGGYITGAYTDGRNPERGANAFVNSNNTAESYLLELGYIDNENDLNDLLTNHTQYAQAIADGISAYLNSLNTQGNE